MNFKIDKETFFTKWLPLIIAVGLIVAVIIWTPLLFIGLILGWLLCSKKDKLKELEKSLEDYLSDDHEPDE